MQFTDISNDTKTLYRLNKDEARAFFLFNRSADLTFELLDENARAFIFAFFIGKERDSYTLNIVQNHRGPATVSQAIVKSAMSGEAKMEYQGTIRIGKKAAKSDASQESRGLLLSPTAEITTKPNLEIIAHDVKCHHAATVSPVNTDHLFYAKSRGLAEKDAKTMLVTGFFAEAFEKMEKLEIDTAPLKTKLFEILMKTYV